MQWHRSGILRRKESGRMFVEAQDDFDYDEAVEALQRVFGIVWNLSNGH